MKKMSANHRHRIEKCNKNYKTHKDIVEATQVPNSSIS